MSLRTTLLAVCATLALPAPASSPPANEYSLGGGRGYLTLQAPVDGTQHFELRTLDAHGASCSLEGNLHDGMGRVEARGRAQGGCSLRIVVQNDGSLRIDGTRRADACAAWCTAGADFSGLYRVPKPGCGSVEINAHRRAFIDAQQHQQDDKATALAARMLDQCASELSAWSIASYQGSLSQASLQRRDYAGCRSHAAAVLAALPPDNADGARTRQLRAQARSLLERCPAP